MDVEAGFIFECKTSRAVMCQALLNALCSVVVLAAGLGSIISLLLLCSAIGLHSGTECATSSVNGLLLSLSIIQALNFIKNVIIVRGSSQQQWPKGGALVWTLLSSCLSSGGTALLLFYIFPRVDLLRGASLFLSLGFIPTVAKIAFSPKEKILENRFWLLVSLLVQMGALVVVLGHDFTTEKFYFEGKSLRRLTPVWGPVSEDSFLLILCIILIPLDWLCNIIPENTDATDGNLQKIVLLKLEMNKCKHKAGLVLPLWKTIWIFLLLFVLVPGYAPFQPVCEDEILENPSTVSLEKIEHLLALDDEANNKQPVLSSLNWDRRTSLRPDKDVRAEPIADIIDVQQEGTSIIIEKLKQLKGAYYPEYQDLLEKVRKGRYSKKSKAALEQYVKKQINSPAWNIDKGVLVVIFIICSTLLMLTSRLAEYFSFSRIPLYGIVPAAMIAVVLQCQLLLINKPSLPWRCAENWSGASVTTILLSIIWLASNVILNRGSKVEKNSNDWKSNFGDICSPLAVSVTLCPDNMLPDNSTSQRTSKSKVTQSVGKYTRGRTESIDESNENNISE